MTSELFGSLPDAWVKRAACKDLPSWGKEVFFPDEGSYSASRESKAICAGCDVRAECLDFALRTNEQYGTWGGMSARERRLLRHSDDAPLDLRHGWCGFCKQPFTYVWNERLGWKAPNYCNDVCKQEDRRKKRHEWRAGKRLQKGVQ